MDPKDFLNMKPKKFSDHVIEIIAPAVGLLILGGIPLLALYGCIALGYHSTMRAYDNKIPVLVEMSEAEKAKLNVAPELKPAKSENDCLTDNDLDKKAVTYVIQNGRGTKIIGKRRELTISKSDFQKLSYEELINFFVDIEDYQDTCNYYTINFGDRTGIVIPGVKCVELIKNNMLTYSKISSEGAQDDVIAFINDGNGYFYLTDEYDNALSDDTSPLGINGLSKLMIKEL